MIDPRGIPVCVADRWKAEYPPACSIAIVLLLLLKVFMDVTGMSRGLLVSDLKNKTIERVSRCNEWYHTACYLSYYKQQHSSGVW